jgi:predicted nucleic acid-binding protein
VSGWLLDTNVLSAFAPGRPSLSAETAAWFEEQSDKLWLSSITIAEIMAGVRKLQRTGAQQRAAELETWFGLILAHYADRVLSFDLAAASIAGDLSDQAQAAGRHPGFADIAVASIAKLYGLVVMTRNLRHFEPLGIAVFDPLQPR